MKSQSIVAAAAFACALAVPGAAAAANAFATGNVNLRAGPGTQYPAVVTVSVGSPVNVYGCLSGYSWCDISWGGTRGWVYGKYLEFVYESRRVAVPAYAASFGAPIISFSFGNYWDDHYRGRSFYRDRDRWDDRRDRRADRREVQQERRQFQNQRERIRDRIDEAREDGNRRRVDRLQERLRERREDFRDCARNPRRCDG